MKKGFTLIEILITLAVIGILASITIVGLSGTREVTRDAKRKTDLENIKVALEFYYSDCGSYPASLGTSISCGTNVYMSQVPTDPQSPSRQYGYNRPTTTRYNLCAALEDVPSVAVSGCSGCGSTCNYKVSGP